MTSQIKTFLHYWRYRSYLGGYRMGQDQRALPGPSRMGYPRGASPAMRLGYWDGLQGAAQKKREQLDEVYKED